MMTVPLLTPEQMARAIVAESDWWQPGPEFLIDFDKLREHIAHAIAFDRGYTRAAEREACALVAKSHADNWEGRNTDRYYTANSIAVDIRARSAGKEST